MNSNHSLSSLSGPYDPFHLELMEAVPRLNPDHLEMVGLSQPLFIRSVGVKTAHLLRTSFELNSGVGSDWLKARKKILILHTRGDLNLGEIVLDIGIMPRILELVRLSWSGIHRIV